MNEVRHLDAKTDMSVPAGVDALAGELPEVRVLRLQPGDVLAICSGRYLRDEEIEEMHRRCAAVWPDNRIAVFECVESVFVLRQAGGD